MSAVEEAKQRQRQEDAQIIREFMTTRAKPEERFVLGLAAKMIEQGWASRVAKRAGP